jgi:predicted ATPase
MGLHRSGEGGELVTPAERTGEPAGIPIVFVVDDDPAVREALSGLIRSIGMRVKTFASAAEFLRQEPPAEPSCLILDVGLPCLSGIDLQRELAAANRPFPIIGSRTGAGDRQQPPVPDLPPQDAQHRFLLVFRRFLGVFAREEHPLALFLDDLQWIDAATLDLLEHLATHPEVRSLLLIGAYRESEVPSAHPLRRKLKSIRKAEAKIREIVLAPLGLDDVRRLVADTLRCDPERAWPLSELVHEKTGGNPFFAIHS